MKLTQQRQPSKSTLCGFTLLEVLVSILVLSFGLLGLAGLQATGIKNNNSAHYRSVAAQYAAEIGDRMRANPTSDYSMTIAPPPPHAGCKTTTGCTPTEMAENDMNEWLAGLQASLPLGTGTITPIAILNPNKVFTVKIFWDDDRSGAIPMNPNFSVDVRL